MTRLERYVLAELWLTFGLALAALTFLMVLRAVVEPVRQGIPVGLLLRCVPLMIPYAMTWTIPTAFVVACVMTYSRMAETNELTAVRASGGHLWMVLGPAAATALLLSAFCGLLNHYVVPKTRFDQYARLRATNPWEQLTAVRLGEPVVDIGRCKVYMRRMNPDDSFEGAVVVFEEKMLPDAEATGGRHQVTYLKAPRGHFEYSDADGCLVFYLAGDRADADPAHPFAGKGEMCKVPHGADPLDFQRAYYGRGILPVRLRDVAVVMCLPFSGTKTS
ncbi:MAG: LptF/LptG family permease, partial [Planctomycetota bacterium]